MKDRIVEINDSVRLRTASGTNLKGRISTLWKKIYARAARENAEVACVYIHEDLDEGDRNDYLTTRERMQKALEAELDAAHYVLAVAELEAWLLLFPEPLTAYVSSWKLPSKYQGKDTGRTVDPKQVMMHQVSNPRRRYRETDAPQVLAKVVELGYLSTAVGTNSSWDRFREDAESCCSNHVQARRGRQQR